MGLRASAVATRRFSDNGPLFGDDALFALKFSADSLSHIKGSLEKQMGLPWEQIAKCIRPDAHYAELLELSRLRSGERVNWIPSSSAIEPSPESNGTEPDHNKHTLFEPSSPRTPYTPTKTSLAITHTPYGNLRRRLSQSRTVGRAVCPSRNHVYR